MKTKLTLLFLIFIFFSFSQEKTLESINSEIQSQKVLLKEKQDEIDFLKKFIVELEKTEGDNKLIIQKKKEKLAELENNYFKVKSNLYDLNEQLNEMTPKKASNEITTKDAELTEEAKDVNSKMAQYILNDNAKKAFANKKVMYKATIWNTNFSIPIARFNFTKNDDNNKIGDIQMFNSIGAGFGMSWGTMTDYRDENGELENSDFVNSFSLHGGFLFSAGSEKNNVFAPVVTFGFLDFQLGVGMELGTITPEQNRTFITLGYAIPLYKLTRGKYLFSKKGSIINEVTSDL